MTDDKKKLINDLVRDLADKIFLKSQENLIEDGSIDTGFLLRSSPGPIKQGEGYLIHYNAPYADVIDKGRRPGTGVPVEELISWVRRKLKVKNEKEAKRVAFLISQKIKSRGIKGTEFFTRAVEQVLNTPIKTNL